MGMTTITTMITVMSIIMTTIRTMTTIMRRGILTAVTDTRMR